MSSAAAQASSTAAVPYFLARQRTPKMRRTPTSAFLTMDGVAERADMQSSSTGPPQQLRGAQGRPLGAVLGLDAIPSSLLAQVFAQQLPGLGIEQADIQVIPLHPDLASDPARRCPVVSGFDLDAAVQMHDAFAVLVIAERLQWKRKQRGFLFGKHGSHLPLGGAVDAGVGPALFPVIEVGLGFFQTLEAQAFQRCSLRMTDAGFDLTFAVWILDAARHSYRAVVSQHIAVERIESGIVNVGDEHALTQIIEHDDARGAAQPAKGSFVQLGPDARTGAEGQQTNRLAAAAQRHHEQPGAPVLAALGIAHHGAGAVINLRLLPGCGDDHHAGFGHLGSAPFAHEALHALVAAVEAVLADHVLPDGPRIPASTEPQLDGFPIRLASAGARTGLQ